MGEPLLPGRAVYLGGRPRALGGGAFGRAAKGPLPFAREFLAGKSSDRLIPQGAKINLDCNNLNEHHHRFCGFLRLDLIFKKPSIVLTSGSLMPFPARLGGLGTGRQAFRLAAPQEGSQGLFHGPEHFSPAAARALAKQPHRWIPSGAAAL